MKKSPSAKKTSVVIVGAGLAGLAAAYELSKDSRFAITILEERNRVGGRTFTTPSLGSKVDVGGFIIYPWYKTFYQLLDELALKKFLKKIPALDIFYDLTGDGSFVAEKDIPLSFATKGKLAAKLLPSLIGNTDVAHPRLDRFGEKSVQAVLAPILSSPKDTIFKTYMDVICQGYCYPSLAEFSATFMLPMMASNLFFGDIHTASYFPKGMDVLHKKLVQILTKRGVKIHLGEKVLSRSKKRIRTTKTTYQPDALILSHPINEEIPFTRFVTLTVRIKGGATPTHRKPWGALFLHPETCKDPHILSIIHTEALYGRRQKNVLTLNIALGKDDPLPTPTTSYAKRLQKQLKKIFPSLTHLQITSFTPWLHTMPKSSAALVKRLRSQQGKDGIFYAGDFLGSPSMETALATGIDAAKHLLKNSSTPSLRHKKPLL